ncbi:hypothetical protein [Kitasatospora sp. NPDC050543]|uniref:hypothetical protein n=1 Tax=Kitasatospora sp. NPDC050543 TaxID=3364054 RepID=UPI0037AECBA9
MEAVVLVRWRAMPADFPAWDRVYAFFRRWRDKGLVGEFHDRLRDLVREDTDRDREPTAGIIDAQSVKGAASVPASTRGFDGGKSTAANAISWWTPSGCC